MRDEEPVPPPGRIPARPRWALGVVGVASWGAGGVATFVSDNGTGTVAVVVSGLAALLLALIGRWPSRIGVSGGEVAWEQVEQTVTSAIVANESDPAGTAVQELRSLLERLEQLRLTGAAPAHPAETYDRAVEAAVRRHLPDAVLTRSDERSRSVPDYLLSRQGRTVAVETKWRQNVTRPMEGSTLRQLAHALPADAVLVVVSNAHDVTGAQHLLDELMPNRGRAVTWRGSQDDYALTAALQAALDRAG